MYRLGGARFNVKNNIIMDNGKILMNYSEGNLRIITDKVTKVISVEDDKEKEFVAKIKKLIEEYYG